MAQQQAIMQQANMQQAQQQYIKAYQQYAQLQRNLPGATPPPATPPAAPAAPATPATPAGTPGGKPDYTDAWIRYSGF